MLGMRAHMANAATNHFIWNGKKKQQLEKHACKQIKKIVHSQGQRIHAQLKSAVSYLAAPVEDPPSHGCRTSSPPYLLTQVKTVLQHCHKSTMHSMQKMFSKLSIKIFMILFMGFFSHQGNWSGLHQWLTGNLPGLLRAWIRHIV